MNKLKTYDDLKNELEAYKGEGVDREQVLWFIAITEANTILNSCTTKDVASLLQEGVKAASTDEQIAEWLLTHYDDQEGDIVTDEEVEHWNERFAYFFGE